MNDNKTKAVMYQDEWTGDYRILIGSEYLGNWDYVVATHYEDAPLPSCSGSVYYDLDEEGFHIGMSGEQVRFSVYYPSEVINPVHFGVEILREVCRRLLALKQDNDK